MEASYYVGIDISKGRLNWHLTDAGNTEITTGQAANTPKGIHKMIGRWKGEKIRLDELLICFEHTGPYGLLLATILEQAGICYVMVSAAQVQLSLGIRRGKSDPIDARRLAEYLWRFRDRLSPSRLPSKALLELRGVAAMAREAGKNANGPNKWYQSKRPYKPSSRSGGN